MHAMVAHDSKSVMQRPELEWRCAVDFAGIKPHSLSHNGKMICLQLWVAKKDNLESCKLVVVILLPPQHYLYRVNGMCGPCVACMCAD